MNNETERSSYVLGEATVRAQRTVLIDYTNHRGERTVRAILPTGEMTWGATEWHSTEQWLFGAVDVDRGVSRLFALKDVHRWGNPSDRRQMEIDLSIAKQLQQSVERNVRMTNRLKRLSDRVPMDLNDFHAAVAAILKDEDPA